MLDKLDLTISSVVKEQILRSNKDQLEYSENTFKAEISDFCIHLSKSHKCLEFFLAIEKPNNNELYTGASLYFSLDCLLSATQLIVIGHIISSGNLFRQAIESTYISILLSTNRKIIYQKKSKGRNKRDKKTGKKTGKKIEFQTCSYIDEYLNNSPIAHAHRAGDIVNLNIDKLGLSMSALGTIEKAKEKMHEFSHPSLISQILKTTNIDGCPDITDSPQFIVGGSIEHLNIELVKMRIKNYTNFLKIIPDMITSLFRMVDNKK